MIGATRPSAATAGFGNTLACATCGPGGGVGGVGGAACCSALPRCCTLSMIAAPVSRPDAAAGNAGLRRIADDVAGSVAGCWRIGVAAGWTRLIPITSATRLSWATSASSSGVSAVLLAAIAATRSRGEAFGPASTLASVDRCRLATRAGFSARTFIGLIESRRRRPRILAWPSGRGTPWPRCRHHARRCPSARGA